MRPSTRRRPRTAGLRARPAAATAAVLVALAGAALWGAGPALADDTPPTGAELLARCHHGTDLCVFHATGAPQVYAGDAHQVGTTLYDCGPGSATQQVAWSETTGETNSLNLTVTTGGGFLDVFKAEVSVSYGHTWGSSETTGRSTGVTVDAGQKGWLTRITPMQRVSGQYELHFGSRFHGHYYWFVPFTMTGPAPGAGDLDVVSQHSAAMTATEEELCR